MNFAWARYYGGERLVISISYDINDPQKERLEPPDIPSLFVARLPWSRLPDLFGGRPLPRSELESWSFGCMPLGVRAYLRDEVNARGLRQSDVALSLGISRTQLVNILRGRFGASPRVTEDLKALAACLDAEIDDLAHRQHREPQIGRPAAEPPRPKIVQRGRPTSSLRRRNLSSSPLSDRGRKLANDFGKSGAS
jgi:transcriptional regulator with XRE-family HTH domain